MKTEKTWGFSSEAEAKTRAERLEKMRTVIDGFEQVVNYEDFGAIGDGVADDSEAIRSAHLAANERGCPVVAKAGATYRIGAVSSPIIVKTDTDWNGAAVIFDDSRILPTDKERSVNVFEIRSYSDPYKLQLPEGFSLSRGQLNVGLSFDKPCMLKIEDNNERIYMRYGENANGGVPKNDMILVDENGNVDPTTPIQYDFSSVTSITVYSTDDKPLYFGNGYLETQAHNPKSVNPDYENYYCYYARGIQVLRSNVCVFGIEHRVFGEDLNVPIDRNGDGVIDIYGADKAYGVPYAGIFNFRLCNNSMMANCTVQGHQAYSFYQGATRFDKGNIRNEMGSYDINASDCIHFSMLDIVQYENPENQELITNRVMYHGIMGSNFCRNVILDNCYLDRFDSHQGVHNSTVKNCTLGFGILVIGGGQLDIENVYRVSGHSFIHLRMDYNSIFNGDVSIRNCRFGKDMRCVVEGKWVSFYNGLPNNMTNSMLIDGLATDDGDITLYEVRGGSAESLTDETNRLILPKNVTVRNVYSTDSEEKAKVRLSGQNDLFEHVNMICE